MSQALEQLMTSLVALAAAIQERRPAAAITELLTGIIASCEQAAEESSNGAVKQRLLADVKPALETWQRVWPRLGTDQDFCLAVARETRLWSGRLGELSGTPGLKTTRP